MRSNRLIATCAAVAFMLCPTISHAIEAFTFSNDMNTLVLHPGSATPLTGVMWDVTNNTHYVRLYSFDVPGFLPSGNLVNTGTTFCDFCFYVTTVYGLLTPADSQVGQTYTGTFTLEDTESCSTYGSGGPRPTETVPPPDDPNDPFPFNDTPNLVYYRFPLTLQVQQQVPEPGALAFLLSSGVGAIVLRVRRRA